MATVVSGWCPVHDRMFESKDGMCPKCGTALVTEDAPAEHRVVIRTEEPVAEETPEHELQPSQRKRPMFVGIAVAVLVAFLAGLAFPDLNEGTVAPTTPRDVEADLNVGRTRTSGEIPLRLESFSQRGRNIVARISVPEGVGLDLGSMQGVQVFFMLAGGGEISDNFAPRTTVSGFIIAGTFLQRGDIPVTGIRIESLQFAGVGGGSIEIDISRVWPATRANQPRSARTALRMKPGDGRTISVNGMVGWADRLELGISTTGGKPGLTYVTEYALGGRSVHRGAISQERDPALRDTYTVRFDDLPPGGVDWVLQISVPEIRADGGWEWSFV